VCGQDSDREPSYELIAINSSGLLLKWLTLCFNRTELNAHLPPLAAHVATPDGTHQESMCMQDRPTSLPTDETLEDK